MASATAVKPVNSRGRLAFTYADRDRMADTNPLPPLAGTLAGKGNLHRFQELTVGLGASQCSECFGWFDDVRHVYGRVMVLHG